MEKKIRINYISNCSLDDISGGWSGLNFKIHQILSQDFLLNYIGPINFKYFKDQSLWSKIIRGIRLKSKYFYYSERKLEKIRHALEFNIKNNDLNVFFGSTPYIKYKSNTDYYIITDISFVGYYKYYNEDKFLPSDLNRIKELEKIFYQNAKKVFFTSKWAVNETKMFYGLDGNNFITIGSGGNIQGTYYPQNRENTNFLFISNNFEQKGGVETFKAFRQLYEIDRSVRLKIIGAHPPGYVQNHPGIIYEGKFDKLNPSDLKKYKSTILTSSVLILPTKSDVSPLSIIECGYFGVPTIAPKNFAIQELVQQNISGFLLPQDFTIGNVFEEMAKFNGIELSEKNELRRRTYEFHILNNNWDKIGNILVGEMNQSM